MRFFVGRRGDFRVVEFSIQSTHLHLIVEASSRLALSRGMQALGSTIARRINNHLHRHGQVMAERYHARALRTPTEVRNALVYVLMNHKHHGPFDFLVDTCSSGRWFTGWIEPLPADPNPPPATWLLHTGWKKRGLISFNESPAH